jgi:hypothetical protein
MNSIKSILLVSILISALLIVYCLFFRSNAGDYGLAVLLPLFTLLLSIFLSYINSFFLYKNNDKTNLSQKIEKYSALIGFVTNIIILIFVILGFGGLIVLRTSDSDSIIYQIINIGLTITTFLNFGVYIITSIVNRIGSYMAKLS